MYVVELNVISYVEKKVTNVRMQFKLILDIISMVVGIVGMVVDEFGRVKFSGMLNLQGRCCRNFCRQVLVRIGFLSTCS